MLTLMLVRTPTLAPLNDPVQQLIFAERGRSVRTVMIDGTVVFDDGAFSNVDVESVIIVTDVREFAEINTSIIERHCAFDVSTSLHTWRLSGRPCSGRF